MSIVSCPDVKDALVELERAIRPVLEKSGFEWIGPAPCCIDDPDMTWNQDCSDLVMITLLVGCTDAPSAAEIDNLTRLLRQALANDLRVEPAEVDIEKEDLLLYPDLQLESTLAIHIYSWVF